MASGVNTKCPICGRAVAVGLVSQALIQHETKNGERCQGSGQAPVTSGSSASSRTASPAIRSGSTSTAARTPSSGRSTSGTGTSAAPKTAPAVKRGVSVRRVEVDQDRLREREEKQERLRLEREARARARNEFYVVDIEVGQAGDTVDPIIESETAQQTETTQHAVVADESKDHAE
ncbi:hydophilic protein [Subtercola sp. PAMC28395]|uniref:hydophilic protein n=1 Tax=Subtercola sp. PAMC28395 TaxID=2846775 RepID=UPI001C0AEA10|nr:hydophilic protein [Subtercola sp. PAMC28395]QWT23122.1 hydophilic protein [Subtercola sp. PAMC28395]